MQNLDLSMGVPDVKEYLLPTVVCEKQTSLFKIFKNIYIERTFYKLEHVCGKYAEALMIRWLENNSFLKGIPSREGKVER